MKLQKIYQTISDELESVENLLSSTLRNISHTPEPSISDLLLDPSGKRLRPALVILSHKAACPDNENQSCYEQLVKASTAVELIHIASLIHDDIIDKATMRHNRPSVNKMYGNDVSVALGDYIYSKAFELISQCENPALFSCLTQAAVMMSCGELSQVSQRHNLYMNKENYISIIKSKTASLFAACCQAGTIVGRYNGSIRQALTEFGMNFGLAFQITDDCVDIIGGERLLGKQPGQDIKLGEMTLPLMILMNSVDPAQRSKIRILLTKSIEQEDLDNLRHIFLKSIALSKTRDTVSYYVGCAKQRVAVLNNSKYKSSLENLSDYILEQIE